ncbi:MAG TPA: hypothetical protein VFQ01_09675 [Nocardioides sp.]|jgi:hypothetical protein|nr:hypothetical protein [Nocardioides sp.]
MTHCYAISRLSVAMATSAALLCACSHTDAAHPASQATTEPASSTPATAPPAEPIDITQITEGTSLPAAKYLVPYLHDHGPMRAVVDVPEGYTAGVVIGAPTGDAAFWGKVTRVATDACLGGSRSVGPSVRELATALAFQRGMAHSRLVPVSVGGYRGFYLKSTAPANLHRCRSNRVLLYTAGGGSTWLQDDVPAATFRLWILNVRGQRVVAGTRTGPEVTNGDPLVHMIETAEFTSVDRP